MVEYTQSHLNPGNCVQTAIACILGVHPMNLPPQHEFQEGEDVLQGWGSYINVINGYLETHHDKFYFELPAHQGSVLGTHVEWQVLTGPSPRTAARLAETGRTIHHAVVGHNGLECWDVHPSRAGLLSVSNWGFLLKANRQVKKNRATMNKLYEKCTPYKRIYSCLCPACGLQWFRQQVAEYNQLAPEEKQLWKLSE